ncbi:phospholipase [Escherichia coli]|nr:phospholipase [Escherichia coli]
MHSTIDAVHHHLQHGTDAWRQQGYEDTMLTMEHIRKPLAARQVLSRSETVLQKSLEITEEADLALRNAMARIK